MQTRRSFSAHLLRRRPQSLSISQTLSQCRDREYRYPNRRRTAFIREKASGLIAMKELPSWQSSERTQCWTFGLPAFKKSRRGIPAPAAFGLIFYSLRQSEGIERRLVDCSRRGEPIIRLISGERVTSHRPEQSIHFTCVIAHLL